MWRGRHKLSAILGDRVRVRQPLHPRPSTTPWHRAANRIRPARLPLCTRPPPSPGSRPPRSSGCGGAALYPPLGRERFARADRNGTLLGGPQPNVRGTTATPAALDGREGRGLAFDEELLLLRG